MKTAALCLVLAILTLVVPTAGVAASSDVYCHYVSNGLVGQLTIMGAQGQPYCATDSVGAVVAMGVATTSAYSVPILGAAPGALQIRIGGEMQLATDRDAEWQ